MNWSYAEFNVYIFLDKRSRLRSNSKVAGEISSLRNEEFFHRFLIENGIELLLMLAIHLTKKVLNFVREFLN